MESSSVEDFSEWTQWRVTVLADFETGVQKLRRNQRLQFEEILFALDFYLYLKTSRRYLHWTNFLEFRWRWKRRRDDCATVTT